MNGSSATRRAGAQVDAPARLLAKRVERAERGADHGRGDAVAEDERERQAVERGVVDRGAGVAQVEGVDKGMRAVLRHERFLDDDVLAAGAAQAGDVPVVLDAVVGARHQKHAGVGRRVGLERRRDAAQDHPLAEVAAARKRPAAGEAKAAGDPLDRAGRRYRGRELRAVVLAPDILLSLRRQDREVPVVHAQHAENPAARPAHRGDLGDRLVEDAGVEFVAAVALRLQGAQQPVLLEIGEGLVGQAAQFLGPPRPLGQRRQ